MLEVDYNTLIEVPDVTFGYIVIMYRCGDIVFSDCLRGPAICPLCGEVWGLIRLFPDPHPEKTTPLIRPNYIKLTFEENEDA